MSKMFRGFKIKDLIRYHLKEILLISLVSLGLLVIDQVTKWIAFSLLTPIKTIETNALPYQRGASVTFIPNLLNFTLITNNGAAFEIGGNEVYMRIIFIIISWVVFLVLPIYILYYYAKHDNKINIKWYYLVPLILIYGGNLGNLIDRTFYWSFPCGVIDFIDINPLTSKLGINFGIFNLADSFIVVGVLFLVVVLIVEMFKGDDKNKEKEELKEIKEGEVIEEENSSK